MVVGERDDCGVVLLDERQDRRHTVVLGGDRVDECPPLVGGESDFECLDDRRVDADRQVRDALNQLDRAAEQIGLIGQRHAHVDVEDHGAAGHLRGNVPLDRRQVAGPQLLLEDTTAGRVDALADDAELLIVAEENFLGGRADDGMHVAAPVGL